MARKRQATHKQHMEFVFAIVLITLVAVFSAANLFQSGAASPFSPTAYSAEIPTGYVTVPNPSGIGYSLIEDERLYYMEYGEEVAAANTDIIVTLDTTAEEGEYLAYELDGQYRADVLVQKHPSGRSNIQLLLNLGRGLHEVRVYVPRRGGTFVESHMIIAI